jgi:A/G-specific adenine glycosylase
MPSQFCKCYLPVKNIEPQDASPYNKMDVDRKAGFSKKLLGWYAVHHRKLPWRETHDPYKIWISEVMLQQTTVLVVIPYYKKWLSQFPDIETLSAAPLQQVLKVWQGLGYYQRAKNLHRSARILLDEYKGKIPENYEELIKLPGFGPYTTAAVLSIAYDKSFPVIDANVRRVWMRIMGLTKESTPKVDKEIQKHMEPFIPSAKMGTFNQAVMELGSLVCKPKNPLCLLCPVEEYCKAFALGEQEIIPRPQRRSYRKIEAVIGVIEKGGKYLIQKRPSTGLLSDLWEFPGGKKRKDETLEHALRREIKEELATEIDGIEFLTEVKHAYTQFQVKLHAFKCQLKGNPSLSKDGHSWVSLRGMRKYPFPSGSAKIVQFLEQREKEAKGTS